MTQIKFNDGTPPMEAKILVKAESVMMVKDSEGHFSLVNRSKVDESKDVQFTSSDGLESQGEES